MIVFAVAFLACKNNKTEKTEIEEPMPMGAASAVAVFEPFKVMVIKHKVAAPEMFFYKVMDWSIVFRHIKKPSCL